MLGPPPKGIGVGGAPAEAKIVLGVCLSSVPGLVEREVHVDQRAALVLPEVVEELQTRALDLARGGGAAGSARVPK